ncbi:MAG: MBL fold metallo-hydrolase [Acidimicrobiia bacterium]|nr:MAG: MBL fold metallo-hydrolase [Acidimicrobiia bacterium]
MKDRDHGTTSWRPFCDNPLADEEDTIAVKEVVSGLYQLGFSGINAFLIDEGDDGLTLIDSGYPKHAETIEAGIRSIGHEPSDLTRIILTHAHPDHLGSAKHMSGGTTPISLHPADADIARAGIIHQTMKPGPGLLNGILFRVLIRNKSAEFPAFEPDVALSDGDAIDVAGGLEVIHTPGHTAGHVCLLWKKDRGLLITGDAAGNMMGLNYMLGYDDLETAKASLTKLAERDFEAAVFGHGKPLLSSASDKFAARFGG